jgi:hypothetical protein
LRFSSTPPIDMMVTLRNSRVSGSRVSLDTRTAATRFSAISSSAVSTTLARLSLAMSSDHGAPGVRRTKSS